jgi:Tol biopolymer transport system component
MVKYGLFLLVALVFSLTTQAQTDIPYIYYYSADRSAFIIERADGADSRIFVRYAVPCDQCNVTGPGWSPSGNWFAWMADSIDFRPPSEVYILNRATGKVTTLSLVPYTLDISWSPIDDFLLIDGQNERRITDVVYIYDPQNDRVITSFSGTEVTDNLEGQWFNKVQWTPDGRVQLQYNGILKIVSLNDLEAPQIIEVQRGIDVVWRYTDNQLPHWFEDGSLAYVSREPKRLVIENLEQGLRESIGLPEGEIYNINWSPDENYAFMHLRPDLDNFELWLLSLPDQSVSLINPKIEWIPIGSNVPFASAWNGNTYGAFVSREGKLFLMSLPYLTITEIRTNAVDASQPLVWSEDGNKLFFVTEDQWIYEFDLETREANVLDSPNDSRRRWIEYIAPMRSQILPVSILPDGYILDTASQTSTRIRLLDPDEARIDTYSAEEFIWHPVQNWLFLIYEDGASPYRFVSITNSDASANREIALCDLNASCFGWLPETILLEQSP